MAVISCKNVSWVAISRGVVPTLSSIVSASVGPAVATSLVIFVCVNVFVLVTESIFLTENYGMWKFSESVKDI